MSSKSDGGDGKSLAGSDGGKGDAKPNAGEPGASGIRKGQKRVKKLDARALENLIRWSLDLSERQQNLLKTALDVVTGDAEE